MAKKKNIIDTDTVTEETVVKPVEIETKEETIVVESTRTAQPATAPDARSPSVQHPKKRIRIRKKATKKLSVAVLCTNPGTRRFI